MHDTTSILLEGRNEVRLQMINRLQLQMQYHWVMQGSWKLRYYTTLSRSVSGLQKKKTTTTTQKCWNIWKVRKSSSLHWVPYLSFLNCESVFPHETWFLNFFMSCVSRVFSRDRDSCFWIKCDKDLALREILSQIKSLLNIQ